MKIQMIILTLCAFQVCIHHYLCASQKGVINVPIADLLGSRMTQVRPSEEPEKSYATLAVCAAQTDSPSACPRLHQLLYNDIVNLIKIEHDEVCIEITHAFYRTPSSSIPQTRYWTLKKNVTPFAAIATGNITTDHIPAPIDFNDEQHTALTNDNIITLKEPHYDKKLKMGFSAGTRFMRASLNKKTSTIHVFAIDYTTMKEHQIQIPRKKCAIADNTKKNNERITDYVITLKKWAHNKQGCIPYVWGGTSFAHTTAGSFKEIAQRTDNGDYSFYQYDKDNRSPKSGFDCSGLVARAAQINGIPYFCKNTTTIPYCLTTLQKDQKLSCGDLMVIRGHVMVVSDIDKHLLIEARSYGHGYGKLHEIPISQIFDGIQTYDDLLDAYYNKKVIQRKDKRGKIRDTFAHLQFFSMASVWDKK